MDELNFDPSNAGKRWVSYFDRLGFGEFTEKNHHVDVFFEMDKILAIARESNLFTEYGELVWFSDTILFYSADDSLNSYSAICNASRRFFDDCLQAGVPVRGAMSFGDLYADKVNSLFFGKALVDACKYGDKFNWLGFVLHKTALEKKNEIGVKDNLSCYKEWKAEVKAQGTKPIREESVVAYLPGPSSCQHVTEHNPFRASLAALEKMLGSAECENHKRKYRNTMQFIRHFAHSAGTPVRPSSR
jgi:hypothetical protein